MASSCLAASAARGLGRVINVHVVIRMSHQTHARRPTQTWRKPQGQGGFGLAETMQLQGWRPDVTPRLPHLSCKAPSAPQRICRRAQAMGQRAVKLEAMTAALAGCAPAGGRMTLLPCVWGRSAGWCATQYSPCAHHLPQDGRYWLRRTPGTPACCTPNTIANFQTCVRSLHVALPRMTLPVCLPACGVVCACTFQCLQLPYEPVLLQSDFQYQYQ